MTTADSFLMLLHSYIHHLFTFRAVEMIVRGTNTMISKPIQLVLALSRLRSKALWNHINARRNALNRFRNMTRRTFHRIRACWTNISAVRTSAGSSLTMTRRPPYSPARRSINPSNHLAHDLLKVLHPLYMPTNHLSLPAHDNPPAQKRLC